jgi:hypothetical protein
MKKQSLVQILATGLQASFKLQSILVFYLINLVLSLIPTSLIIASISNNGRNGLILQRLDQQFLDAVMDLSINNQLSQSWLLMVLAFFLLQRLCYDFFTGGAIASWDKRQDFLAASMRWFLTNIVISIIVVISFALVLYISFLLATKVHVIVGALFAIVLLPLLNNAGEYARVRGIASQGRNPFSQFIAGLWFCIKHPATWVICLIGIAFGSLPENLLGWLLNIGSNVFVAIVLQQLIILVISWNKVLRLSWAYHYFTQRADAEEAPTVNSSPILQAS